LSGVFKRVNTKGGTWFLRRARCGCAGGDRSGFIDCVTVERFVSLFLSDHTAALAPNTPKNYEHITAKILSCSREKGFVLLEQWTPADVREFRPAWKVRAMTAAKNMSIVKASFEFALTNEWIGRNPARFAKSPRVRAGDDHRTRERLPFTDEEWKRMFDAGRNEYGNGLPPGREQAAGCKYAAGFNSSEYPVHAVCAGITGLQSANNLIHHRLATKRW